MNLKTIAFVCSVAAITAPFSVRADNAPTTPNPATTPQPEGRRGGFRGLQGLTQEEQTKYRAALEAIRNDPKVQAAREKATAAFKESEETQNAAMIGLPRRDSSPID
jgi:hypothetical protein